MTKGLNFDKIGVVDIVRGSFAVLIRTNSENLRGR
jgi:hypothetical protein